MENNKILGIEIQALSKRNILEKIKKFILNPKGCFHITSLNPENLFLATENELFKKALNNSQIRLIDGAGIVIAGKILKIEVGERVTGVNLMDELVKEAAKMRLRILLIGGKGNLADKLADCYQRKYPQAKFFGIEGIKNIKNPQKNEEKKIFSIVTSFKPHLVFVAFGSPYQELWIERYKRKFSGCVVMGVGGAFDFLGGAVPRAPIFFQKIGLEWLFRLIVQPWRWRRQLRLIKFLYLVRKEKLNKHLTSNF